MHNTNNVLNVVYGICGDTALKNNHRNIIWEKRDGETDRER